MHQPVPAAAARRPPRTRPLNTPVSAGSLTRLGVLALAIAALWLAVYWAMQPG